MTTKTHEPLVACVESAMPHCFICSDLMVIVPGHTKGVTLINGKTAPICDNCMIKWTPA